MSPSLNVLGPLRHHCTGCGGCCHGVIVWLNDVEQAQVRNYAQAMGLPEPVVDRRLRFDKGRCVFQLDGGLCHIHAEHGLDAKPMLCRQYPLVLARTEDGLRAGVDPGCYDAWQSWVDGPELQARSAAVEVRELDPRAAQHEDRLLDLLDLEGLDLARFASMICDELPPREGLLPVGFARRLVVAMRRAKLSTLLTAEDSGAMLRDILTPMLEHIESLDPDRPQPWPVLAPSEDALALEVLRRLLFLRLVKTVTNPTGVVILGLAGAVVCAWYDPRPEVFGTAFAAWCRTMRAPAFLQALVPDPPALLELATGRRGPA